MQTRWKVLITVEAKWNVHNVVEIGWYFQMGAALWWQQTITLKSTEPAGSFAICAHRAIYIFFAGLAMLSFVLLLEPQMCKNKVNINIKGWPCLFILLLYKSGKICRMIIYDKWMNNLYLTFCIFNILETLQRWDFLLILDIHILHNGYVNIHNHLSQINPGFNSSHHHSQTLNLISAAVAYTQVKHFAPFSKKNPFQEWNKM